MKLFRNFILLFATILVFEFTFVKNADAACAKTGDVYDVVTDFCEAQPDEYEIVIFNLYLCTSSPTIPTTTSTVDLTSGGCEQIFDNSSNNTIFNTYVIIGHDIPINIKELNVVFNYPKDDPIIV